MSGQRNRFFLVVSGESGVLHDEELDFNSLIHDVVFSAVCNGRLANDGRWEPVTMEPEWAENKLAAVTVNVAGQSRRYGRAVFGDRVMEVLRTRQLLSDQRLDDQAQWSWHVEVRTSDVESRTDKRRASIRHQAYPIMQRALIERNEHRDARPEAPAVLVSADLLRELREESSSSLDRERGDFLTGHLVQEPGGQVAVVLRSRIPADTDTEGSLIHFSFSPRTFQAAQRQIEQRATEEVILGWHHNHPPPCGRTCLMTIPACRTDNVLFSVDDRVVHRSAFSRPYMVALVSGKGAERRADDPVVHAYGWHQGRICEKELLVF
jgi:hypothetical protein